MSARRRKRRQKRAVQGFGDGKDGRKCSESVERLAFKYMEKCKVESSTDSDSDTSPEGCVSSTPESGAARKVLPVGQARGGRYHLPSLDPYDGSSEDSSDESDGNSRRQRQGGSVPRVRGQTGGSSSVSFPKDPGKSAPSVKLGELQPPTDIQMRSSSDSEVRAGEPVSPRGREGCGDMPVDSGVHTESSLSTPGQFAFVSLTPVRLPESPSYRSRAGPRRTYPRPPEEVPDSPAPHEAFPKRKSGFPGVEAGERALRKKQRTVRTEDTE
ncbi:uncharacterized protein LOC136716862 [Amia ocellicauda]|uniref:uncharacterized protein LOC136716862 n=1 Tax=Amia ocellicauda TaxID=2972642 RepID=UPI003464018A